MKRIHDIQAEYHFNFLTGRGVSLLFRTILQKEKQESKREKKKKEQKSKKVKG